MTYNTPTSKEGTETMLSYTKMMPIKEVNELKYAQSWMKRCNSPQMKKVSH